MFENLMMKFTEARDKLIDNLTKELIKKVGCAYPTNATSLELLMFEDEMKRKGYRIKVVTSPRNTQQIHLVKIEDLHESLVYGYELDVISDQKRVSIMAVPIE